MKEHHDISRSSGRTSFKTRFILLDKTCEYSTRTSSGFGPMCVLSGNKAIKMSGRFLRILSAEDARQAHVSYGLSVPWWKRGPETSACSSSSSTCVGIHSYPYLAERKRICHACSKSAVTSECRGKGGSRMHTASTQGPICKCRAVEQ